MTKFEPSNTDRAFAATAGVSATPANTPPTTSPRHSVDSSATPDTTLSLPLSAYCIIFVEGCERFCYYGLKAVLLLYFMQYLKQSKDTATASYHFFSFLCYFTPTIGAIISDGFIGRYWTITVLSLIYFVGTFVLTITAIPVIGGKHMAGPIIGLLLVAFGTGGIKPCVSAFGADQIPMSNPNRLSRYFAFFYFSINLGSLMSTIITPLLRSQVHCFGYDCYTLAFGVPGALMLTAIIIFLLGTPLYKRVPPKENIIAKFIAIIWRALQNKLRGSSQFERKEHWVCYADDKYEDHDIEDVRAVLRVCLLFTPIPIFYALYDQSGSRWTYQASLMDGSLGSNFVIQPDQMQALNSLFVLLFIPLFEHVIYPLLARYNLLVKALHRMVAGMLIMIIAFIAAGIIQVVIQTKASTTPIRTSTKIFNGYDCPLIINNNHTLASKQVFQYPCQNLQNDGLFVSATCQTSNAIYKTSIDKFCPSTIIISQTYDEARGPMMTVTPLENMTLIRRGASEAAQLRIVSLDGKQTSLRMSPNEYHYQITEKLRPTEYQSVISSKYRIKDQVTGEKSEEKLQLSTTSVYTAIVYNTNDTKLHVFLLQDTPSVQVHMLWQTIQYILMTVAEIFVSITGLVFAYSQSPKRYKTVIMSAWLLTAAFGDLLIAVIAKIQLVKNQALEFFIFAGLLAVGSSVFAVLAYRYEEFKPTHEDSENQQLIMDKRSPPDSDSQTVQ